MQKFASMLVALLSVSSADWELYKRVYGKNYTPEEDLHRHKVYEINVAKINAHNLLYKLGLTPFLMKVNGFTDRTFKELLCPRGCTVFDNSVPSDLPEFNHDAVGDDLPPSVDWREKGYVTPVKVQDPCGSCWAFSAVGAVEGQNFNATGKLVPLSVQNLVDCSRSEGNHGCEGGLPEKAFRYIEKNGVATEDSYMYEAANGKCRVTTATIGARIKGFLSVASGNERALQKAVATVGPVSVSFDANEAFHHYGEKIFHTGQSNECSTIKSNHSLLIVGYGTEKDEDYWLVKNSWGTSWGLEGYAKIPRNKGNFCGIATRAVFPIV